jgi:hypothetical protein
MLPRRKGKPKISKELKKIEENSDPNTRIHFKFKFNQSQNKVLNRLIRLYFEGKKESISFLSDVEFETLIYLFNDVEEKKDIKKETKAEKIRRETTFKRLKVVSIQLKGKEIVNNFTYDVKLLSYLSTLLVNDEVKDVGSIEENKKYSYGVLFFILQLKPSLLLLNGKDYSNPSSSELLKISPLLIAFVDKVYNKYLNAIGGVYITSDILKYAMLMTISPHLKYLPENISLNKLQNDVLNILDFKNDQTIDVSAGTGSGKTVAMLFVIIKMLKYIYETQSTNMVIFTTSNHTSIIPIFELFNNVIPFAIVEKQPNGRFNLKGNNLYVDGYNSETKIGGPFVTYCSSDILTGYLHNLNDNTSNVKYYLVADEAGDSMPIDFVKHPNCTHLIKFGISGFNGPTAISQQNTQPFISLYNDDSKRLLPIPNTIVAFESLKRNSDAYRTMDPAIISPLLSRSKVQPSPVLTEMLKSLTENPLLYVNGLFIKRLYDEFLGHFQSKIPPELKLNPFQRDESDIILHVSSNPLAELNGYRDLFSNEFKNTEYKSYDHMSSSYLNDKAQKKAELESKLDKLKSKTKQDELIQEFQSKDETIIFKGKSISEIAHLLDIFDGNEFLLYLYLHKIGVFYEDMPKSYFDYVYSKLEYGEIKHLYVIPEYTSGYNFKGLTLIVNTANLTENQVFQCIGRIGRIGLSTSGKVLDMNGSIIRVLLGI